METGQDEGGGEGAHSLKGTGSKELVCVAVPKRVTESEEKRSLGKKSHT